MNILDEYTKTSPSYQNTLDIFKGEWSCKLPFPLDKLITGTVPAFEDPRISLVVQQLGNINGCNVLELGPLEGGHTYMLEKLGANSIISIESNTRSYLKCLIIKEVLNLKKVNFLFGDFIPYLQETKESFDICIASGVLYHMRNPAELIYLISQVSNKVMIWTHYYDQVLIEQNPIIPKDKFSDIVESEYQGFKHTLHRFNYQESLNWSGFCGGSEAFSLWMSKQDILSCLNYFGFNELKTGLEQLDHPNGPCFCVVGLKSDK